MTVREFLEKAADSLMVRVESGGTTLIVFDADYVSGIIDGILDLEVETWKIQNASRNRVYCTVMVPGGEAEPDDTEPGEEEPDDGSDGTDTTG